MIRTDLQEVAQAVVRRAQRQNFVLPSDIREELAQAGIPARQWKEVVPLCQGSLRQRQGRYYYQAPLSARMQEEQRHQRAIHRAVRQLIRQYKKDHALTERRQQGRTDFVKPVKVRFDNNRELTLLSRDLSPTGIRLVGTHSLLGKKVRVLVPRQDSPESSCFLVRILWTSAVADGIFENGGTFLEMVDNPSQPLKVVDE